MHFTKNGFVAVQDRPGKPNHNTPGITVEAFNHFCGMGDRRRSGVPQLILRRLHFTHQIDTQGNAVKLAVSLRSGHPIRLARLRILTQAGRGHVCKDGEKMCLGAQAY
jgi:hypothetical protein